MANIQEVTKFWNYISKFPYGIYSSRTGKPAKDDESYKYMIYQSPQMMRKHGFGMCYDCCAMETEFFKRVRIQWQNYFIELDSGQTHTFSTFMLDGKLYYFESSFKAYAGIWEQESNNETIERVLNQMLTFDKIYKAEYAVYKYKEYTNYGCNVWEFKKGIERSGEKIRQEVFMRKE